MKRSLKILTLVLSLALICGALVVAAFAGDTELTGIAVKRSTDFTGASIGADGKALGNSFSWNNVAGKGTISIATDINGNDYFQWTGELKDGQNVDNAYITTSVDYLNWSNYAIKTQVGTTADDKPIYEYTPKDKISQTGTLDKYDTVLEVDVFSPTGNYEDTGSYLKVMIFGFNLDWRESASFCSNLNVEPLIKTNKDGTSSISWKNSTYTFASDTWTHITIAVTSKTMTDATKGDYLSFSAYIYVNDTLAIAKENYGTTLDPKVGAEVRDSYNQTSAFTVQEIRLQPQSNQKAAPTAEESIALDNIVVQQINKETYNGNFYDVIAKGGKLTEWESNNYNKANMPLGNVVATNNTTGKSYDDLQYAVDCANTGDTLTLVRNATIPATVAKAISINTAGFTCDVSAGNYYAKTVEGDVISFAYAEPAYKYVSGGEEKYAAINVDLKTVIGAADPDSTVTILADIERLNAGTIYIGKNLTVDFNGKTVTNITRGTPADGDTPANISANKAQFFTIQSNANVTFMTSKPGAKVIHAHDTLKEVAKDAFQGAAMFELACAAGTITINGEGLTTYCPTLINCANGNCLDSAVYINGGTYIQPYTAGDNAGMIQMYSFKYFSAKNATFYAETRYIFAFGGCHYKTTPDFDCVADIDNCVLLQGKNNTYALVGHSFDKLVVNITNTVIGGNILLNQLATTSNTNFRQPNLPGGTWNIGEGCVIKAGATFKTGNAQTGAVTINYPAGGLVEYDYTETQNYTFPVNTFVTGDINASKVFTDTDVTLTIGKKVGSPVDINGAALTIGSYIDMMYYVSVDGEPTDLSATFNFNGKTTTVTEYTTLADGRYVFVFEGINPYQMGDAIDATITATIDGKTYTASNNTMSVRAYYELAQQYLAENTKLLTLMSDLLVYGAAAQTFVGDTDALVTEGLELTPTTTEFVAPESLLDVQGEAFKSASLYLDHAVTVRFTVVADEDAVIRIGINDKYTYYNVSELEKDDQGRYIVEFAAINSTEYDNAIWATVVGTDNYVRYSVNSYVNEMANSEDAALAALVKALYTYGATADAYN